MAKLYNGHELKCRYCNEDMEVDDVDHYFQTNYDIYWRCPKCGAGAIEKIRFNMRYSLRVYRASN